MSSTRNPPDVRRAEGDLQGDIGARRVSDQRGRMRNLVEYGESILYVAFERVACVVRATLPVAPSVHGYNGPVGRQERQDTLPLATIDKASRDEEERRASASAFIGDEGAICGSYGLRRRHRRLPHPQVMGDAASIAGHTLTETVTLASPV
jgi:hypothetical protein